MTLRVLYNVFQAKLQSDGSGFTVCRPFPHGKNLTDQMTDPFLLLDEWGPKQITHQSVGLTFHPHRGHDVITYFKQGSGAFKDILGVEGAIAEGEAQFMRAGSGVIHEEGHPVDMSNENSTYHAFQIWTNLPKEMKMCDPLYQHLTEPSMQWVEYSSEDSSGVRMKIITGTVKVSDEETVTSPVVTAPTEMLVLDLELAMDGVCVLPIPDEMTTLLVYVYCGLGKFGPEGEGGAEVQRMHIAAFDHESKGALRVESMDSELGCHCIVMAGKPIGEPITSAGGFVMNDPKGVMEAFKAHKSNTLTTVKAVETQL